MVEKEQVNQKLKQKFTRGFGWRYGLMFGLAMVVAGWGLDGWRLADASAELSWVKVMVAALTVIPLGIVIGMLAGRAHPGMLTMLLIWMGYGIFSGWIVGHLQYQVMQTVASVIDPAVAGLAIFPYTSEAQFLTGVAIFLGIVASFPASFFQVLATDWAWDRSSADAQMTWGARAMLIVAMIIGAGLGLLDDSMVNQLTMSISTANRVIQVALQTPADLDTSKMTNSQMFIYMAGVPWRDKISNRYTVYLADYEPNTFQNATMDIAFDSGVILRCRVIQARIIAGCFDASAEFGALVRQFVQTGATPCPDCAVRAQPAAIAWQSQQQGDGGEPTNIQVVHHSGSVFNVRVDYGTSAPVECTLVGNDPVVIQQCAN